jgi:hypothetical protein
MGIIDNAKPVPGWNMHKDGIPPEGTRIEIMHFGNTQGIEIMDTAAVDKWGIKPDAADGGHSKRSTVTHWRYLSPNAEADELPQ